MYTESSPSTPVHVPRIRIERITHSQSSLICRFNFAPELERCFSSSVLYFNYDFPIEGIPESVLSIPILGVLVPVAWVTGARTMANEADTNYVACLQKVAAVMQRIYPTVRIVNDLECTKVDTPWSSGADRTCLLYSGGVDSTVSLLRNLGPNISLMSVRGTPDMRLWEDEFWVRAERGLALLPQSLGVERHVVETNALDVVNFGELNRRLKGKFDSGWWENIAHGLLLISLCSPYTYVEGINKMMIASSYSRDNAHPWGSTPDSDQNIAWGGLTTIYDSFDMPRAQKVREILVPFMVAHPGLVRLRVCTGRRSERLSSGTLNCGRCEKCVRTEMLLMWAGVDPVSCGFPTPNFAEMKEGLISGRYVSQTPFSLLAIQKSKARPNGELISRYPAMKYFFDWFYGWKVPEGPKRRSLFKRIAPVGSRRKRMIDAVRT